MNIINSKIYFMALIECANIEVGSSKPLSIINELLYHLTFVKTPTKLHVFGGF